MSRGYKVLIKCATCGAEKWKPKSQTGKGKNGLNFCKRACKDKAQKIGGPISPEHNGKTNDYRTKAFRSLPHLCNRCGYCKNKAVLQVHHKDDEGEPFRPYVDWLEVEKLLAKLNYFMEI